MKRKLNKRSVALLVSLTVILTAAVGVTLAYIFTNTKPLENIFTPARVSCAVVENGVLLASAFQATGLTHSRTLMPIVEHILKNTDLTMADVDAIAVAAGPGSFTGVRIGVSAAKGFAEVTGECAYVCAFAAGHAH